MWNNWIGRRIRSGGRALMIWGVVCCAGALAIGWFKRDAIDDLLLGPIPVDAETLSAGSTLATTANRSIAFDAPDAIRTGATVGFSKQQDRVFAAFLAAPVGNRWLLIQAPATHTGSTFVGTPSEITANEHQRVISPFAHTQDIDASLFLPFQLNCTGDRLRESVPALFFMIVLLLPGIALIAFGIRRVLRPGTHPLARALARFGPPAEVAAAIDQAGRPLHLGPLEFAGDWLICDSPSDGYIVFRSDDLVWMHKLELTINRSPSHRLKLYDRHGVRFEGKGRADVIAAAAATVTARWPWLPVGWDERIEKQWKEDPASLMTRVKERREELKAKLSPPPA